MQMEKDIVMEDKVNVFGKEESIQLKGILVIIMFWAHMFAHPERMWDGVSWSSLFSIGGKTIEAWLVPIFHVAVPLFFFIGGYAFWLSYGHTVNFQKVRRQIARLYQKYLLVFAVCIPVCFALGILKFDLVEFLLNVTAISSSYCGEWWFLFTYVLLLIFFHFVNSIVNKVDEKGVFSRTAVSISVMVCSIALALFGYALKFVASRIGVTEDNLLFHHVFYLLIKQPLFALGYVTSRENLLNRFFCRTWEHKAVFFGLLTVGAALCIALPVSPLYKIPETFFYILYLPLFIWVFCGLHFVMGGGKVFLLIGKNSTYMWLIHSILLYKFVQPIIYAPRLSILCWLMLIVLSLVCAVILGKLEKILCTMMAKGSREKKDKE